MFKGFGKTPSLSRVLAMHGPASAGMLLLEAATPQNACQLENGWEKALAPTTNQVAPRMDFADVLWETMVNKTISPGKCRDTASRVNTVLTAQHNVCSADDPCHPVMVSKGYLNASQYEKRCVPFMNRPFESEIHGTVNFTYFCCVLLVTWCHRVLLSCYLRPK